MKVAGWNQHMDKLLIGVRPWNQDFDKFSLLEKKEWLMWKDKTKGRGNI